MQVVHAVGIEGARDARGVVVVIDVLRSFTVSAYALAGGARDCLLVSTIDKALALARSIPDAVVCAEEGGLPVPGIAISNSPTQIQATDLEGRTLIQRSSAGTPVIGAVEAGDAIFAGSLVVASATAQACLLMRPSTVTLVASADFPEDHACARYIEAVLTGVSVDLDALLRPLLESERYRTFMAGEWPGFAPSDLELSLAVDRFDFAMPGARHDDHIALRLVKNG
ncbi:MAG TPA: 2-phosphosulfolactate phosphatase [Candidatus Dormibacteraeota bacterium]